MTRKASTKTVDTSFGAGRLSIARAYLKAARNELLVADANDIGNPAMSQIVNAAIPFSDALTATHAGTVNPKTHAASIETLRAVLGNRLPDAQETNLRRITARSYEGRRTPRRSSRV